MATQPPPSASRYYTASALAATRAADAALEARPRGLNVVWSILRVFQVAQAQVAERAVGVMLDQQSIDVEAEALLNSVAFTTDLERFEAMAEQAKADWEFRQLMESLTQDAGRSAEGVAIATRPRIGFVRLLAPPSCSRCAVLAGRAYRYSDGFLRHPGCDCVMVPTTLANDELVQDPVDLMERGLITDLSKADQRAIQDGADFNKVVNARRQSAGMTEAGRVLGRAGRPTPEAIYRANPTREDAMAALQAAGYLR